MVPPLLRGVAGRDGASFYGSAPSTALHSDLCSPIATDPTWNGMRPERALLREEGVRLWHALVRLLEPNVIVASVERRHLDESAFAWDGGWRVIHTVDWNIPYVIEARWVVTHFEANVAGGVEDGSSHGGLLFNRCRRGRPAWRRPWRTRPKREW